MDNQAEFIVRRLKFWPGLRAKMVAALAQKDLSDRERRIWLSIFKRWSRSHRDRLHWADWYDAMPPAELAEGWREFVQTGTAILEEQERIISARLAGSKLPPHQHCALLNMFVRVLEMRRDFEGYENEMIAFISPQNSPEQMGGEQSGNRPQMAGGLPEKPRD